MKNFFLLLFCFVSSFGFSQKYHFDYFAEDTSKDISSKDSPWVRNYFYDSKSNLKLHLKSYENELIASLYDDKMRKSHIFHTSKKGTTLSFVYSHSFDYKEESVKPFKDPNKDNEIVILKVDSLHYKVNVFKDAKRKKEKYKIDVFLEKNDVNFLELPMEYSRSEEIIQKLKLNLPSDQKYIIKTSNFKSFHTNKTSKFEITKFEKTDLTLVLPVKLKIVDPIWNKE